MAVTVTVEDGTGVTGANSYASVADADAYFDARPRSDAWVLATAESRANVLLHATRILDASVLWDGEAVSSSQALAWPRVIDDETVALPPSVKVALYELAITLNDRDLTADPATDGVQSLKVGPIEITADSLRPAPTIPRFVRDIVAPYGTPRGSSSNVRLIRR